MNYLEHPALHIYAKCDIIFKNHPLFCANILIGIKPCLIFL